MKNYSFLQEGIGLTNACAELRDADPKVLALIGPNTLEQYGHKDNMSIKINYCMTSEGVFMIHDFVVTGRTMDKEKAFGILNAIKYDAIGNKEHEGGYKPARHVNIRFRHTDNHDRDEIYDTTLYDGEIKEEKREV